MKKQLFTFIFLASSMMASESSFFPAQGGSNQQEAVKKSREVLLPLDQTLILLPKTAKSISKVTIEYRNKDNSFDEYVMEVQKSINTNTPIALSQVKASKKKATTKKYEKVGAIKNAKFYTLDKKLKIVTKNKMIRHFLMKNPNRIIVDFKSKEKFNYYVKNISKGIFAKIKIGSHPKHYRVVVELNKKYNYKIKKISDGYTVDFK